MNKYFCSAYKKVYSTFLAILQSSSDEWERLYEIQSISDVVYLVPKQ